MPVRHEKSEISEAQYQSLIESIFRNDFRLGHRFEIDFYDGAEERRLGYDMEIKTYIPIFLQLKRSNLYLHGSITNPMQERENNYNFRDFPGGYYFNLHVDHITQDYLQHNLLFQLNHDGNYARYIAPLFIEKGVLEDLNYNLGPIYWQGPYHKFLRHQPGFYEWRDYFDMNHSILIKPHLQVHRVPRVLHKYFFNRRLEASFHSESERIEREFSEFLGSLINRLNSIVTDDNNRTEWNINDFFLRIINSIKSVFKDVQDWENKEMLIINSLIEREALNNEFPIYETLSDLKPSRENFRIIALYFKERFNITTILLSKKEFLNGEYL